MITGEIKEDLIRTDEILQRTQGGYDIYMYYLGKVSRIMNRPWGRKEKKLSWGIFPLNGIWFWKDSARDESGTAIQFVEKLFNLTFIDAVNKIVWDFGLGRGKEINAAPVIVNWESPYMEKEYAHIDYIRKPFTSKHHKFWNVAGASEVDCNNSLCFAVKSLAINRKFVPIKAGEIVFAYECPEEQAFKIYFPERPDSKFKNNVSGKYLWNFNKLEHCNNLILQKSNKDLIISKLITPCVTATQNESVGIFDEEMVSKINSKANNVFISYGSDPDGKTKSIKISKLFNWKWVNPPNKYLPEVNDIYGLAAKEGLKAVEKLFKSKNII